MLWRALAALALVLTSTWAVTLLARGEPQAAWPALPMMILAAWVAAWRGEPGGRLFEVSGQWWFEDPARGLAAQPGTLRVSLDLGRWMLLCFRPDGARRVIGNRWLALAHRDMPTDWRAFRRAVYSSRPVPAGLSAQAPADPPA